MTFMELADVVQALVVNAICALGNVGCGAAAAPLPQVLGCQWLRLCWN